MRVKTASNQMMLITIVNFSLHVMTIMRASIPVVIGHKPPYSHHHAQEGR